MPNKLKPGKEIVPGYVLVRRLGSGGSGEVWVARASGGVEVAVKILSDLALIASDRELEALRIVREAKHPNLCPLFGVWFFDQENNLLSSQATEIILGSNADMTETVALGPSEERDSSAEFDPVEVGTVAMPNDPTRPAQMVVAMGLGEQTLMDRLVQVQSEKESKSNETLDVSDISSYTDQQFGIDADELMRYMSSSALAIDELNERHNIYHCDIKPQNILLVGGQAQVCDFGLARKVEDSRKTTIAFGTPAYGAPEMLFQRTYSKTIDQYSLAVTYYELRTGKLPYSSVTQSDLLRAKATGEVDLSRVSPAERAVLLRATDLDPTKRFENCQAMVTALEHAIQHPDAVPTESDKQKTSLTAPVVVASIAAILAVLGFIVPWGSLLGSGKSTESTDQTSVENAISSNEPLSVDMTTTLAGDVESTKSEPADSDRPKTTQQEPELSNSDINTLLADVLISDSPDAVRLRNALKIIQSPNTDLQQLSEPSLLSLVDMIEKEAKSESGESADPELIIQLCKTLVMSTESPDGKSSPVAARLQVGTLVAATRLAQISNTDVPESYVDAVRQSFNSRNEFAHPPLAYDAALAIGKSWQPKFRQRRWIQAAAESDLRRLRRLSLDFNKADPDLAEVNRSYLAALLMARSSQQKSDSLDDVTVRTARTLEDHETFGSLARSAISLIDPTARRHAAKPINDTQSALAAIHEPLHATYLLGAGWNHWVHEKDKTAFASWKQATELPTFATDTADDDRHLAAKHMLDWLLIKADVPDNIVAKLRYSGMAGAIDPALSIARHLADGNADLTKAIDSEKFICSVAAGDYEDARSRWENIEPESKDNFSQNRQLGRALFDLSTEKLSHVDGTLDAKWVNRLLVACNSQADPSLFSARKDRPANSLAARDDLFQRCFKPTMERIRDRITSPEKIVDSDLDETNLSLFCDRIVSLLTESDRRTDYGGVSPCMKDITLAATIAGRKSNDGRRRSQLFYHAAIAFAREYHEQTDDRPYSQLLDPLREYQTESKKFGTNAFTDCLDGLISTEVAFRETDPQSAFNLHANAIGKYSSAIRSRDADKDTFIGLAYAGRSLALQRGALMQSDQRKEQQLNDSLQDARKAVELIDADPYGKEYALENLARVCCASSQISQSMDIEEKLELIVDGTHAVEGAIAIRKNKSLGHANFSVRKLFVRWIDTLVSMETPHSNAAIEAALKWTRQTERIGKDAKSTRLKCNWYFNAAMVMEQAREPEQALSYLVTARELAGSNLEPDERVTHLVTLAHINLRSYRIHVGEQSEKIQLIDQLTKELGDLTNPTPPIAAERDVYLKALKEHRESL